MATIYKIEYQLGGVSRINHRTLAAAVKQMHSAKKIIRKHGDQQSVSVIAIEDGCQRDLTPAEFAEAYLS